MRKLFSEILLLLTAAVVLTGCSSKEQPAQMPAELVVQPAEQEVERFDYGIYCGKIIISELMVKNHATLADAAGEFCDYIELYNASDEDISLDGWSLSDKAAGESWKFHDTVFASHAYLTVYTGGTAAGEDIMADFGLSAGETVHLFAPDDTEIATAVCLEAGADQAQMLTDEGYILTRFASPGFPNDDGGRTAFSKNKVHTGPIVINEILAANTKYPQSSGKECYDWVELKNISSAPVMLSDYYITDDNAEPQKCMLPQLSLGPGEMYVVFCSGDPELGADGSFHCPFKISSEKEKIYVYDAAGLPVDYMRLYEQRCNVSYGISETGEGYFTQPTLWGENGESAPYIAPMPVSSLEGGCYDGVEGLTVELSAAGTVYYTLDGSRPGTGSALYDGPITLEKTTVVRAISYEEGALPSNVMTVSYIINEGLDLPVLSLAVDDRGSFNYIYDNGIKYTEYPANLSLYDAENSFSKDCGVSMQGWTSLTLPKKSMCVSFGSEYAGKLSCDVFGNGITEYNALSIRAGQDNLRTIYRNELLQQLAMDCSDTLLCQESKFCILFINGEYRGIYVLKENFNRQYYASHFNVSKDSVTMARGQVGLDSPYYKEVLEFVYNNDMSVPENYAELCNRLDINSLIDWVIFEGYCANTDTQGNVRFFRSTENGGKWSLAYYDLDWAFYYADANFANLYNDNGNCGTQMPWMLKKLGWNSDFRAAFLTRMGELMKTTLSNENVIAKSNEYAQLIESSVARDRTRWYTSYESWSTWVDELSSFITNNNWANYTINQVCGIFGVSAEERAMYFGA